MRCCRYCRRFPRCHPHFQAFRKYRQLSVTLLIVSVADKGVSVAVKSGGHSFERGLGSQFTTILNARVDRCMFHGLRSVVHRRYHSRLCPSFVIKRIVLFQYGFSVMYCYPARTLEPDSRVVVLNYDAAERRSRGGEALGQF